MVELLKKMVYTSVCLWILGVLKLTQQQPQPPSSTVNGVSVYTDETEMISVMEGDSVTLNTDVTEIQRDDLILWTFRLKNSETRIAEIYKQSISIYDYKENNERFRDRLQMDEKTGSLTITNINKLHSGLYKVQIINGVVKHKSFNIAVYALLTVPVISDSLKYPSVSERSSKQNCSLLCSAVNVSHVTLSWYKGNSLLSSISVSDLSISLSLPLEIQCLDDSYSCVVSYSFTNQTKHLNITDLCQTCPGASRYFTVLIIVVPLVLVIAGVVLMYCYCKNYKRVKQEGDCWTGSDSVFKSCFEMIITQSVIVEFKSLMDRQSILKHMSECNKAKPQMHCCRCLLQVTVLQCCVLEALSQRT